MGGTPVQVVCILGLERSWQDASQGRGREDAKKGDVTGNLKLGEIAVYNIVLA